MARKTSGVKAFQPKNLFRKHLNFEFKDLFKALVKGVGHVAVAKWEELGSDAVETLAAIGLTTEPGELAYLLIRRSTIRALFELVGSSSNEFPAESKIDEDRLAEALETIIANSEFDLDHRFLDRPADLPLVPAISDALRFWLLGTGVPESSGSAISQRFPNYFVYALNEEWRQNAKSYKALSEALDTPFTKATAREQGWSRYESYLQRQIDEPVFDEPFSLKQIYIPLNAYCLEQKTGDRPLDDAARGSKRPRVVVPLHRELEQWIDESGTLDALRVLSGGPGSGKSSFARIFAAAQAARHKRVLFVPLHLIDPSKDLTEEIGRFVTSEGVLTENPLNPDSPEPHLTIIFDGLDELASQGKSAAETARGFVREVEKTLEKRNAQSLKIRVLMSGREIAIQENQSEFRRERQVLFLLPYYLSEADRTLSDYGGEKYIDPQNLLSADLRHSWWQRYGTLTGKPLAAMPPELVREDLDEVTAQPLLNFLLALSFTRGKVQFNEEVNLNAIYADLVAAVYERAYEKRRLYAPIRHMALSDFSRVLEEIGLAAWHGDGRTTTVSEIESHCQDSGLDKLLESFKEGAREGVTRLLAAFFFRQYGVRPSGDATFVFTHKSFGEYLTARRILRGLDKSVLQLDRKSTDPDDGWDEKEALKNWAMLCGPSAVTFYLQKFLFNELRLRPPEEIAKCQARLTRLFNFMLRHGLPMEQTGPKSFKQAMFESRNAEEALLVALNSCARITRVTIAVEAAEKTAFGTWFKRIQGQRDGSPTSIVTRCLSHMDLSGSALFGIDFLGADLNNANLADAVLNGANLQYADLQKANLQNADLYSANLQGTVLQDADLRGAHLEGASLLLAKLQGAKLQGAKLQDADLQGANLRQSNLRQSNLRQSNLRQSDLRQADLRRADLQEANLQGANLRGANLRGTNLRQADLRNAILDEDSLKHAILDDPDPDELAAPQTT